MNEADRVVHIGSPDSASLDSVSMTITAAEPLS